MYLENQIYINQCLTAARFSTIPSYLLTNSLCCSSSTFNSNNLFSNTFSNYAIIASYSFCIDMTSESVLRLT